MHPYIIPIQEQFKKNADPENSNWSKAYMRNQFDFFGLDAKLWRKLTKEYIKQNPVPSRTELTKIVKELWSLPEREYQYFAVELIASTKKQWDEKIISLIEYCITHKSWWETVDHCATDLTGPYFKLFPHQIKPITGKWNTAADFWLQRSSIMFQKFYKKETDTKLLAQYIKQLAGSKEFFVQKAIGWALREYSKTDPVWVKNFVKLNELSPLSKREALKRI